MEAGKMKHPRYEALLFEPDPLEDDEKAALEEHLQECEHCLAVSTSWNELEGKMRSTTFVEPTAGFTDRFRNRLAVYKRRKQERLTLAVILAIFTSLIVVAIFAGVELLSIVPTILSFLLKVASGLAQLGGLLMILWDFILVLIEGISQAVPAGLLLAISTVASGLAIIWIVSKYQAGFYTVRRE
jgi:hypothetical protein